MEDHKPAADKIEFMPFLITVSASMAATAAVQLVYWSRVNPVSRADSAHYVFMARSFLALDFPHAIHYHFQPLFPLLIAVFLPWTKSPETAIRIAVLAAFMLTAVPVYILSHRAFNQRVATVSALLMPFLYFRLPVTGSAEALLNLLFYAALAVGIFALGSKRPRLIFLTGIVFGLDGLAKIESQAFFVFWSMILAAHLVAIRYPWRRALLLFFLCWLGYLLALSPYLVSYYRDTGKISVNPKVAPLFFGHNEPDWSQACYSLRHDASGFYTLDQRAMGEGDHNPADISLFSYLASNFTRLVPVYASRLVFTVKSMVPAYLWFLTPGSALLGGLVILLGLLRPGWTRAQFWNELYVMSFLVLIIFIVPLFIPQERFFMPLVPGLTIFFARGLEQLSERSSSLLRRVRGEKAAVRARLPVLAVLMILAVVINMSFLFRLPRETEYYKYEQDRQVAADWIKTHLTPGRKIMSSWMDVAFWYLIGLNPEDDVFIPLAPPDDLIAYARQENVEFLILESGDFLKRYKNMAPMLDSNFTHPGLKRVYDRVSPNGIYFVIYRIEPENESGVQ